MKSTQVHCLNIYIFLETPALHFKKGAKFGLEQIDQIYWVLLKKKITIDLDKVKERSVTNFYLIQSSNSSEKRQFSGWNKPQKWCNLSQTPLYRQFASLVCSQLQSTIPVKTGTVQARNGLKKKTSETTRLVAISIWRVSFNTIVFITHVKMQIL